MLLGLGCALPVQAAVFDIANGDVAGLIAAIEASNSNGEDDIINLANNGLYEISSAGFVGSEGFSNDGSEGAIAFPRILNGHKLVINGNGSTIRRLSNGPQFRLFLTQFEADFEIHDLTLENGLTNKGGAALFISFKSNVLINNCVFRNNESTGDYGGAIKVRSRSFVTIQNSYFTQNKCYRNGGAVYNTLSDLVMTNNTFYENYALSSGGGIYIDGARGDNGTITIDRNLFDRNQSGLNGITSGGGGLYLYLYNRNTSLVSNCTFTHNQALGANGYGGGLDYGSETLVSADADYPYTGGPNDSYLTLTNSLFYDNYCTYLGGGIIFGRGAGEMHNCTVVNNRAVRPNGVGGSGGGIYVNDIDLTIMNCTIAYNFTGGHGGGIAATQQQTVNTEIFNSILAYNLAFTNGNSPQIKNNCQRLFTGANNLQFPEVLTWNPNDNLCAVGILIADPLLGPLQDNGGPTLTMALLPGSPAIDAGGNFSLTPATDQRGVAIEGANRDIGAFEYSTVGVVVNTPANLTAVATGQTTLNLTWIDNSTNETGFTLERSLGNIFNFAPIATLFPNSTSYQDQNLAPNTTYYYRIRAEGGESAEWSNLAGASTTTAKACDNTPYRPVIMTNPTAIVGNGDPASCTPPAIQSALNQGGRIVCNCGPDPLTIALTEALQVKISGTVFDGGGLITLNGNHATRIFQVDEGADFTLQNTRLVNGLAPASGGLFAESGGAILIGSGITGNGGGEVRILSCQFENNSLANLNSAERGGGAIYAYRLRNLIISESRFTGNSANVGGAIAGLGSQVILVNTDFIDNEAAGPEAFLSGVGGAVYLDGIDLWDLADNQNHIFSVCGSVFTGNQGKHEGGAIYTAISDSKRNQVVIDRSHFENNRLVSPDNGNGGAIFHVEDDYAGNANDPAENFILINSSFVNNTCPRQGGALWTITGGGGRIENATFEGNTVTRPGASLGGGIAFSSAGYGGNWVLNNLTFANNQSAHFAGAVFGGADNTIAVRNSLFSNNTSDFEWEGHQLAGPAAFSGSANIQFPENRWNGTADNVIPGRISVNDPLLSPVTFNGGFTKTMALQTGSEAIDNPNAVNPTTTDQRGLLPVNTRDLGAFEFGAVFSDAPIVLSFDPVSGNLGSLVTITGTGFTGATAVAFNFAFTTTFMVVDDQTIIATVPDFATTGKISVTNAFGTGYSLDDFAVIIPLPTISAINPLSGPQGTVVTITGTDFIGTTEVLFNGAPANNFTILNANTIEAIVPVNATTGKITVSTGGGQAESTDDFSVTPSINSFTPLFGGIGTEVTIRGTNLDGTTSVRFNGTLAVPFMVENPTTIRATVAAGTPFGPNPIALTAGDGNDYLSTENFTILPSPTVSGFTPASGTFGTTVIITGSDFTQVQNVTFNGANALGFAVLNATSIEVYVPQNATTGPIAVVTPGGTAVSADNFTVLPTIVDFTPKIGGTGTIVSVYGTNLAGATAVTIGGTPAGNITPVGGNGTQLNVTVAGGATGLVQVITPEGTADSEEAFTFVPAPLITGFGPATGTLGTQITITGTGFTEVSEVLLNGLSLIDYDFSPDGTSLTFNIPANATSGLITIVAAGGTVVSATPLTVQPTIAGFVPTRGAAGATVTINGANFTGATAVSFNGVPAASFTFVNPTTITAVVPGAATDGPIIVTTPGGVATSAASFDFVPAPTINTVNPDNALVGAIITITGTNFLPGETTVSFNGTNAPTVTVAPDGLSLTVTVPAGVSSGLVSVVTPGGAVSENFTVTPPAPAILSFDPPQGVEGTVVNLTGTNLGTTTEVRFNGVAATNITITNTTVSAVVPIGASTGFISLVTNSGTATTNPAVFTVIPPAPPIITGFTPANGPVGTVVSINGDNFTNATQVLFNGVPAIYTVVNDGRITATVPNATTGFISVTTSGGTVVSNQAFVVPFVWTGNVSTVWNEANNWSPVAVPNGLDVDVLIPNVSNDPVLNNHTATVRNLSLQNGASLSMGTAGVLEIGGTFVNQGTFVANQGTVVWRGTALQQIPANIAQFQNLTIDNPANVRLLGNISVSNQVNFINGNLELNGRTLDLGTTGSLQNESETSRITGNTGTVVAILTGANDFLNTPVNIANLGATITIPTTSGLAGITVRRGHTRRGELNLGIARYFSISPAGASDNLNANLDFQYFEAELSGLLENNLILYRYNGNDWEDKTATTLNAGNNTLSLTGIPRFSEWTAGDLNLPLPVIMAELKAQRQDVQTVKLEWKTFQEEAGLQFEIQKSVDAGVFQTIGTLEGGQTLGQAYVFMDWQAQQAGYYRLKYRVPGQSPAYSATVYVPSEGQSTMLSIYPNPVVAEVRLNAPELDYDFKMRNAQGVSLLEGSGTKTQLEKELNETLQNLPAGIYILQLNHSGQRYEAKLVKP
ncbi:MAG: hypothetical protein OHK0053_18410 [Microscillaceae bacterium]